MSTRAGGRGDAARGAGGRGAGERGAGERGAGERGDAGRGEGGPGAGGRSTGTGGRGGLAAIVPRGALALLGVLALAGPAAQADPAAWRVTGDGRGELLLLGSVHYLRERDYPLPAIVDELYARADALVMELDMDDIDPAGVQSEFLSAALLRVPDSLADVLEPEVYERAQQRAAEFGVDLALFERFEPWLVAITLLDLGMSRLGYRPDLGVEQYLLAAASGDGKEIHGLETLASQIQIFDGLPRRDQQAMLDQTLAELDAARTQMDALVGAWRDGSLDALTETLMEEFEEFPGLYDALVSARNEAWIERLEGLSEERGTFLVVVGALHLVGENSVVDLLERRGFEVSRLRSP